MSKNERLARTWLAGFVFVALGVFATMVSDVDAPSPGRSPASTKCELCDELNGTKGAPGFAEQLLGNPGPDSTTNSAEKAAIEIRESSILRSAGTAIFETMKDRDQTSEELVATTTFLVKTYDRDGDNITIQKIADALHDADPQHEVERMEKWLVALEAETVELRLENVVTADEARDYLKMIKAYRDQGTDDVGPTLPTH